MTQNYFYLDKFVLTLFRFFTFIFWSLNRKKSMTTQKGHVVTCKIWKQNKKSTADVCWNTSFCPSCVIWKNDTFRTKKSTADVRWNTSFCPWLVKYGPDVLINLYLKNLLTLWRWISPGRGSKRVVSMVKEAYLCSMTLKIKANLCTWQLMSRAARNAI